MTLSARALPPCNYNTHAHAHAHSELAHSLEKLAVIVRSKASFGATRPNTRACRGALCSTMFDPKTCAKGGGGGGGGVGGVGGGGGPLLQAVNMYAVNPAMLMFGAIRSPHRHDRSAHGPPLSIALMAEQPAVLRHMASHVTLVSLTVLRMSAHWLLPHAFPGANEVHCDATLLNSGTIASREASNMLSAGL